MAQSIRPDGDISTGNWTPTPVADEIDEVTPSDSDFVESELDPANDTFEVSLDDPGGDPDTGTGTCNNRVNYDFQYRRLCYWRCSGSSNQCCRLRRINRKSVNNRCL